MKLTEKGLLEGDLLFHEQVCSLSGEDLVRLDVNLDVQITRKGVWDLVSFSAVGQDVLVRGSHVDGDINLLLDLDDSLSVAVLTDIFDDLKKSEMKIEIWAKL